MAEQDNTKLSRGGIILPFMFDNIPVRGKLLRLDNITDQIPSLTKGEDEVARLMAEMVTSAAVFAFDLKGKANVTLQIHSESDLPLLVAKCNHDGILKAFAHKKGEDKLNTDNVHPTNKESVFAVSVQYAGSDQPIQSMVPIQSTSISASVGAYFEKSAQLRTFFQVFTGVVNGKTSCAAMFLQAMPEEEIVSEDDWRRLGMVMGTVKPEEVLSPDISETELLARLFSVDDTVRIFDAHPLFFNKQSSRKRMAQALKNLGVESCRELLAEGPIEMTDEYAGTKEIFNEADLKEIFGADWQVH